MSQEAPRRSETKDLGTPIPPLEYADFIGRPSYGTTALSAEKLPRFLFDSLLRPSNMPIHPAIYNRPEVYTDRFVDQVVQSMPGSLRFDIGAAASVLGLDLVIDESDGTFRVLYQDAKVCQIYQEELERSRFEASSSERGGKYIGYDVGASKLVSGVSKDGKPHYTNTFPYPPRRVIRRHAPFVPFKEASY